ncbi:MAG: hypothetical protein ACON5H_07650 [Akkermansiaceae bacterium]
MEKLDWLICTAGLLILGRMASMGAGLAKDGSVADFNRIPDGVIKLGCVFLVLGLLLKFLSSKVR